MLGIKTKNGGMAERRQIIMKQIEKLTWYQKPPENFPCLVCRSGRRATEKVILTHNNYTETWVMCPECATKTETELWDATI